MKFPDFKTERKYLKQGFDFVIGVDEVGMGPIAGPVVSAACVLNTKSISNRNKDVWYSRVRDSKTTSEEERVELLEKILGNSNHGIGISSPREVDKLNIFQASLLCKKRAVEELLSKLKIQKKHKILVITDGKFVLPNIDCIGKVEQIAVVKGDTKILSISSASVIAKVWRDNLMKRMHKRYPMYGFDRHKGYGTKMHREKIRLHGPISLHRKTFIS